MQRASHLWMTSLAALSLAAISVGATAAAASVTVRVNDLNLRQPQDSARSVAQFTAWIRSQAALFPAPES